MKISGKTGDTMTEQQKKSQGLISFEKKKDQIMGLWFQDCIEFGQGCTLSIKIKGVLYHGRSAFQEIAVLDTEKMGRLLVIDGVTMLTEYDEFAYHEMIATFLCSCTQPHPVFSSSAAGTAEPSGKC